MSWFILLFFILALFSSLISVYMLSWVFSWPTFVVVSVAFLLFDAGSTSVMEFSNDRWVSRRWPCLAFEHIFIAPIYARDLLASTIGYSLRLALLMVSIQLWMLSARSPYTYVENWIWELIGYAFRFSTGWCIIPVCFSIFLLLSYRGVDRLQLSRNLPKSSFEVPNWDRSPWKLRRKTLISWCQISLTNKTYLYYLLIVALIQELENAGHTYSCYVAT